MAGAQEALLFRIHVPFVAEEIGIVSVSLQACFVGKVNTQIVPAFLVARYGKIPQIVRFSAVGKLGDVILAGRRKIRNGRFLCRKIRTARGDRDRKCALLGKVSEALIRPERHTLHQGICGFCDYEGRTVAHEDIFTGIWS